MKGANGSGGFYQSEGVDSGFSYLADIFPFCTLHLRYATYFLMIDMNTLYGGPVRPLLLITDSSNHHQFNHIATYISC